MKEHIDYLSTLFVGIDIGNMGIGTAVGMLEPYAAEMPTEAEVMEFYDSELTNIRRQLQTEYGEEFVLSYRITDMNELSRSTILAYNEELDR